MAKQTNCHASPKQAEMFAEFIESAKRAYRKKVKTGEWDKGPNVIMEFSVTGDHVYVSFRFPLREPFGKVKI